MAVLPYLEASVIVNGNALPEYDAGEDDADRTQDPNTVVKYVEAISGAEFAVRYTMKPGYKGEGNGRRLGWILRIDGAEAYAVLSTKDCFRNGECVMPDTCLLEGTRIAGVSQDILRSFNFSCISFEQQGDQGEQGSIARISNVGTLELSLWSYQADNSQPMRPIGREFAFNPLGKLSEESLKGMAVSHTVGLGTSKVIATAPWVVLRRVGVTPLASFVFKYRSRKALQDLMILPRSPSPSIPPNERPVENLTVEEMRELIQQQRAEAAVKKETPSGIKRERQDSNAGIDYLTPGPAGRPPAEPDSDIECTGSRQLKKPKVEEISLLGD